MLIESAYSSFEEFLLCMEAKTLALGEIELVYTDTDSKVFPSIYERGIELEKDYGIKKSTECVSLSDIDEFFLGAEVQDEVEEKEKEEIYTGDEVYTNDGEAEIYNDTGVEQEEDGEIIEYPCEEYEDSMVERQEGSEEDEILEEEYNMEYEEEVYNEEYFGEDDDCLDEVEEEESENIEFEDETEEDELEGEIEESFYVGKEPEDESEEDIDNSIDVDEFLSNLEEDLTPEEVYEKEQLEKKIQSSNENKMEKLKKSAHFEEDEKSSMKSVSADIPRTFTEYVKIHPYCKLHELYQLYDRKEIDKAIKIGKLFRLGDRVYM